jgi:hypothetical protein
MFAIFAELWVRKHPAAESSCPYKMGQSTMVNVNDAASIAGKSEKGEDDRGRSSSKSPSHSRAGSPKIEGEHSLSQAKPIHDGSSQRSNSPSPDGKSIHDGSSHSGVDLAEAKPVGGGQKWLVLNKHKKSSLYGDSSSAHGQQRKFMKRCKPRWPSTRLWERVTSSSN